MHYFLYNCTPCNFEHLAQCLHARRIDSFATRIFIFCWHNGALNCKMSNLLHLKRQKVCLCRVWIRSITAYLLCARELWQNNALSLQFWCLFNALTLRVLERTHQISARMPTFWCVKCTNPRGECIGRASKLKRKCICVCVCVTILEHKVNTQLSI